MGLSKSTIYAYIAEDKFPKSVELGGRARGWFEDEVDQWLLERVNCQIPKVKTDNENEQNSHLDYLEPKLNKSSHINQQVTHSMCPPGAEFSSGGAPKSHADSGKA